MGDKPEDWLDTAAVAEYDPISESMYNADSRLSLDGPFLRGWRPFTPEESDALMKDVAESINQWGQEYGYTIITRPHRQVDGCSDRYQNIDVWTYEQAGEDPIMEGAITYEPPVDGLDYKQADRVRAEIFFNSDDLSDRDAYVALREDVEGLLDQH